MHIRCKPNSDEDNENAIWQSALDKRTRDAIKRSSNRPLWVCDRLGMLLGTVPETTNFTSRERLQCLRQIEHLTEQLGRCERIQHQTAVPLHYARHSLRSLTVWLWTLPLTREWASLGFAMAPAVALFAWMLLGVYQIGYSIEDPFQDGRLLQLTELCHSIRQTVLRSTDYATSDSLQSLPLVPPPPLLEISPTTPSPPLVVGI